MIISGGWNSQKDASDTNHDPWLVKGIMEKTEMMPIGWSSKNEASKTQHNHTPVKEML